MQSSIILPISPRIQSFLPSSPQQGKWGKSKRSKNDPGRGQGHMGHCFLARGTFTLAILKHGRTGAVSLAQRWESKVERHISDASHPCPLPSPHGLSSTVKSQRKGFLLREGVCILVHSSRNWGCWPLTTLSSHRGLWVIRLIRTSGTILRLFRETRPSLWPLSSLSRGTLQVSYCWGDDKHTCACAYAHTHKK